MRDSFQASCSLVCVCLGRRVYAYAFTCINVCEICLCTYGYVYMHICAYVCMCGWMCVPMSMCIYVCKGMCLCVDMCEYIWVCTHAYVYMWVPIYMYLWLYVCKCICVCVCSPDLLVIYSNPAPAFPLKLGLQV